MKKQAYIIVGLGYGDEGKGLATDYLCSQFPNSCVIRFNGGQQAGHTVVTRDLGRHVFSNFGSGSLRGIPTYWSRYCTFSPAYFLCEYNLIKTKPILILSPNSPVTTHYDVLYNRAIESTRDINRHGSCGLGFGATLLRHNSENIKLSFKDLFDLKSYKTKLKEIKQFYESKINQETKYSFKDFDHNKEDNQFDSYVDHLLRLHSIKHILINNEKDFFANNIYSTYIFEGSQGILLDINFGQQPHVTKSNTTTQNALEIINRNFKSYEIDIQVVYVTRAYQTKHGAGSFRGNEQKIDLRNIENETNQFNEYQGIFRTNCLNVNDINYAIGCDNKFSERLKKNLIITCLDQVAKSNLPIQVDNKIRFINYLDIPNYLSCSFETCKFSSSSYTEDLK